MNHKLHLAVFAFALISRAAPAAVIDFENTPAGIVPLDDGLLPVLSTYNSSGVQISFGFDLDSNGSVESDARFEKTGTYPGEGFNIGFSGSSGTDTPDPLVALQMKSWFLRSPNPGMPIGRFVIQYTSSLTVTGASGEIWDIDGNVSLGVTEQYAVSAYDVGNNLLATLISPLGVLDTPIAPLDGQPWTFAFSGLSAGIDHIVITFIGTKTMGIGLAFDNFNPVAVPEPASASLLGVAALGLLYRLRRPVFGI
jgi:hypothetical protein